MLLYFSVAVVGADLHRCLARHLLHARIPFRGPARLHLLRAQVRLLRPVMPRSRAARVAPRLVAPRAARLAGCARSPARLRPGSASSLCLAAAAPPALVGCLSCLPWVLLGLGGLGALRSWWSWVLSPPSSSALPLACLRSSLLASPSSLLLPGRRLL